jgi:L-fucose isomerase-like protein
LLNLYAFGVERHSRDQISLALDFPDIDEQIRVANARKQLREGRVALFGFPPPAFFSQWHHLPDLESARQRTGVRFTSIEIREWVDHLRTIDDAEARRLGEQWRREANAIVEPSPDEITESARLYLSLAEIMEKRQANAMAVNCLDLMRRKAPPPCYAMTRLRDEGIHAACEGDVVALLTMMMLGFMAEAPAFMGNIAFADPESNILRISHCVVPTRMSGYDRPPSPFTLRNYHGRNGVTAHVDLGVGREVTLARLSRNLDQIGILNGELVECKDTTTCRTTLSVRVEDARGFVRKAFGNHHALIYGDHRAAVRALASSLYMDAVDL